MLYFDLRNGRPFGQVTGLRPLLGVVAMRLPLTLLGIYILVFAVCAVSPYDRTVWLAENLTIFVLVLGVAFVFRYHRFSNTRCVLMLVLPVLHTIGGHYTFERVPFGFVTDLFGFSRNHYDRIAHFSVGFYAYPLAEILLRKSLVRNAALVLCVPVVAILALAGAFEIFEWIYAISADPTAGAAFLGSQGDVWDAQKDMLADTLGAVCATALFYALNRKPLRGMASREP